MAVNPVNEDGLLDVTKISRATAIKAVMLLTSCTKQQAMEFVDLAQGKTLGDVRYEEKPRTRRTKEEGSGQETEQLLEDGEIDAGAGSDDDAGASQA